MDGLNPDDEGLYTFPEGWITTAPGLSGMPEENINCRCNEAIEVEGV